MEGFDDPSDFVYKELQTIDEHVRCPICKEIFTDIMMLSTCSHSFCALCIRRCLSAEQVCPKCRKPSFESNLIHNYDLDNVVRSWRASRTLILQLQRRNEELHSQSTNFSQEKSSQLVNTGSSSQKYQLTPMMIDDDDSTDYVPSQESKRLSSSMGVNSRRSTRLSNRPSLSQLSKQQQQPLEVSSVQAERQQLTAAGTLQVSRQDSSKMNSDNTTSGMSKADSKLTSSSMVECPICLQQMRYVVLDKHIDKCNGEPPSGLVATSSKPTKKPVYLGKKPVKQVYAMLNDRQLTELLRSFNLPDHGDRSTKIWRHKEYISLYNANVDSSTPVSAQVLIQRLIEMERSIEKDKNNQMKRKAANPEDHKAKYASQFSELIQTAKKNRTMKKEDD
ncbi:hypothetical protein BDF20DRAFT_914515 [Mycotypha africana]|uniref:uncharacterized protein n=1 Tax=Mycotypha africana TaxID=64632 RepID=UPI002300A26D|nr:uncharacterized protein BDF20DRAFT_914515 [Mycotypha africana]KAI8975623.1 hypothetical protein BDF20DRAFT_914515 [Mycotypha africana]